MTPVRRAVLPLLLSVALALPGCGDDGLDRGDPMAVFRAAMAAVHDGDWNGLQGLLTSEARREMERDLDRIRRRLAHPKDGERERALATQRLGERAAAEIDRVVHGGYGDALRFFSLIVPRERAPTTRGMEIKPRERKILYVAPGGTIRAVRLVLVHGEWSVADLPL